MGRRTGHKPGQPCPLTGFPLDYSFMEAHQIMDLLDEEQIEGPVTGVAKNMDRKVGLPSATGSHWSTQYD